MSQYGGGARYTHPYPSFYEPPTPQRGGGGGSRRAQALRSFDEQQQQKQQLSPQHYFNGQGSLPPSIAAAAAAAAANGTWSVGTLSIILALAALTIGVVVGSLVGAFYTLQNNRHGDTNKALDSLQTQIDFLQAQIDNETTNFPDDLFSIFRSTNANTRATFDASAITSGDSRVYDFPNLDGILALTTGNQTFTDKTMVGPSNTIEASAMQTTGGAAVVFSSAAPPIVGQVPVATGPEAIAWQTLALGGVTGFHAWTTVLVVIPSSSTTTVVFANTNTNGGHNEAGDYNNATGVYTVPVDGFYDIAAFVTWTVDLSGSTLQTTINSGAFGVIGSTAYQRPTILPLLGLKLSVVTMNVQLDAADTIIVRVFHDTVTGSITTARFGVQRVA